MNDKQRLINWIKNLDDESVVNSLLVLKEEYNVSLEWNDLPKEAQESALRGLEDIKQGRSYTSAELWSELKRRQKNRV